jgi:hypothetical protein
MFCSWRQLRALLDGMGIESLRGSWSQGPCPSIRVGERRHDRSTPGAAEVPILVSSPVTRVETKKAAQRFSASDRATILTRARLHPCKRHTGDPLRVPTDHPSPSAREFRLLLNGLAASALRRMFCSWRQLRALLENTAFDTRDGGLVQVSGRVKRWHARSTPGAAAVPILVSESGETVKR